jgi:hypothetical protein
MRRKTLLLMSSLLTSLALVGSEPQQADAAMICPPNPLTECVTWCPVIQFCYNHFHQLGCGPAYDMQCSEFDSYCEIWSGHNCCDIATGENCGGGEPYCTLDRVDCYF